MSRDVETTIWFFLVFLPVCARRESPEKRVRLSTEVGAGGACAITVEEQVEDYLSDEHGQGELFEGLHNKVEPDVDSTATEAAFSSVRHAVHSTSTDTTTTARVAAVESFRDEVRVWRLGENLNVKYSLAARLVSGLSGPARMTCMTMDADQLHPPPGDGPVATADERRNIAGLDHVMNVLQTSLPW